MVDKQTNTINIYSSMYTSGRPGRPREVLKYISTIRSAAKRCKNMVWINYDQQFCFRMAAKLMRSWSAINYELWLLLSSSSGCVNDVFDLPRPFQVPTRQTAQSVKSIGPSQFASNNQ